VLPAIILVHYVLCDEEKRGRVKRTAALIAPFAMATTAYLLARWSVFHGVMSPQHHRPLMTVIWTWPRMAWFYVQHLLWPFGLSCYYDVQLVKTPTIRQFALPAIGLVLLAAAYLRLCRGHKRLLVAGFAMAVPILPAIAGSMVFQPDDYVHDRYLYLSTVTLCLVLGAAVMRMYGTRTRQWATVGLVAAGLAVATAVQCEPWDNDVALFEHAVQHAPHNIRAIQDLAAAYGTLGDTDKALQISLQAIKEKPEYWETYCNVAIMYYQTKQYDEAERLLLKAISVWPQEVQPMSATQFYYLGMTRMAQGRFKEAEPVLRRAVELRPDLPGYHFALGNVLRKLGNEAQADIEFKAEAVNRRRLDDEQKELGDLVR